MSRPARATLDDFIGREHSATSALLWPGGEMPLGTPTMVLPQSGYRAWNNAFEMRKGHWQGQAGRQVLHFTLLLQRASPNKGYGLGCEHAWYPADNSPRCSGELVLGTHFVQAEASFQNRGSCIQQPAATSSISGGASSPLLLERLRQ